MCTFQLCHKLRDLSIFIKQTISQIRTIYNQNKNAQ